MALSVAVQMDDIFTIDVAGDSTFAMMLEAQARGHALYYYLTDSLAMRDGEVFATVQPVTKLQDVKGDHAALGPSERRNMRDFDVVLMRQDPPFDMHYISATHMLERIHPDTLVVNDPAHVRNAPEKLFVIDFADLMPPTLVTRSPDEVKAFRAEFKDIIVKPLYGNGGEGVFRLTDGDTNLNSLLEMFLNNSREPVMVQQYLPDVRAGDKRIILVDGEPVGIINRVPAADETRSNMHVGGRAEAIDMTDRDREICDRIGPELKKRGFMFVGIDVIGSYLTEINVTSPTGIREVKKFGGADIAALIWDAIEAKRP